MSRVERNKYKLLRQTLPRNIRRTFTSLLPLWEVLAEFSRTNNADAQERFNVAKQEPSLCHHGMLAIACISSQRRSAPSGATGECLYVYDSPFSLMFSMITSMGTHSNAGSWYIVPEAESSPLYSWYRSTWAIMMTRTMRPDEVPQFCLVLRAHATSSSLLAGIFDLRGFERPNARPSNQALTTALCHRS